MVPWSKNQIWYWVAAFSVFSGAAILWTDGSPSVTDKNSSQASADKPQIIRRREDLEQSVQQWGREVYAARKTVDKDSIESPRQQFPNAPELPPTGQLTAITAQQQLKRENPFNEPKSDIVQTGQVRQTGFPLESERPALIAPDVVQANMSRPHMHAQPKPIVWLSGSIEKISDSEQ